MKKPLSEHPNPQFERKSYLSLNGYWDYEISKNPAIPSFFSGKILVPYSPEAPLSEVNHILQPDEYLFYKLEFSLNEDFIDDEVYLHFLAVDQICDVYLNDIYLGHHEGGYLPFKFEIKNALKEKNILIVRVIDKSDKNDMSRGKQRLKHGGIWYTPQSGIYYPVYLESVPKEHIENIRITPDIDNHEVIIKVDGKLDTCTLKMGKATFDIKTNKEEHIKLLEMHLWSVEDPYLYPLTVKMGRDEVNTYFAMRKFSILTDEDGYKRFALNNKPIFMKGVLDQGYYFGGLLTPSSYDDYVRDIELVKSLGFNTIRKHIKVEIPQWYYECDKRGMIVWQDFINGGDKYNLFTITLPLFTHHHKKDNKYLSFARKNQIGREKTIEEFKGIINYLYNFPSIALWTIFNEGWGQFDSQFVLEEMLKIDNTRLYDHASGWHDQGIGDIKSMHFYFQKAKMPKNDTRCLSISEFGGLVLPINGHYQKGNSVYTKYKDVDDFMNAYQKMIERDIISNIPKGLSASIYTQLSDVEEEVNGFITYDREVIKVDVDKIKEINSKIRL